MQIRVVFVEPEHEGNIGLIARIMKNFGFADLWIVNPKTQINSEARAYASHADDILRRSKIVTTLDEALKDCDQIAGTTAIPGQRPSNILRVVLSPEEYAEKIGQSKERICLVFGRESTGLSNEELNRCDIIITIPASKDYRTLNVASACAIVLYESYRHMHGAQKAFQPVDSHIRARLVGYFEKLVGLVGVPSHRQRKAVRAFRNVISRGLLSKREALLLMGIIRRACNRTKRESKSMKIDERLNTAQGTVC